jgi:hypothetical protein
MAAIVQDFAVVCCFWNISRSQKTALPTFDRIKVA